MHNERSGGNISLLQIAASAAGRLNNRERERGAKKKEASHSWLASKTEHSLGAIHSQGPEPGTWRLAKAGGRERRRGGGSGGWMGDLPASTQKKKKTLATKTNYPPPLPSFSLFSLICNIYQYR